MPVPLDGCADARGLFDGENVFYDVHLGDATGPVIAPNVAVTPVPYARFADQVGVNNDCPVGYARNRTASPGVVCVRSVPLGGMTINDEVVKVGVGRSAFWVDRYEASVHLAATGVRLGESDAVGGSVGPAVETSGLTPSGQRPRDAAGPAQALSHPGQPTVNITWFQANEACRAAGKRLLKRDEWFAAASGTVDGTNCNVLPGGARASSPSNGCTSTAGAHDMIGNVWEWTNEWYAGNGPTTPINSGVQNWPSGYNMDATWNINGAIDVGSGVQLGIPSVALRGGTWGNGTRAGVFALNLSNGPTRQDVFIGFRCVVPG